MGSPRLAMIAAVLTILGLVLGRNFSTSSDGAVSTPHLTATTPILSSGVPGDVTRLVDALQRNPDDVRALQQLGVAYVRRAGYGDPTYYDLARGALDRASRLAPDDDVTLVARGVLELSLHHFSSALRLAERAHAHTPAMNDALAVLVDASVELGRYSDAQRYLQELVDRRPSLPAYARVSYLRELNGDLAGAVEAMNLATTAGAGSAADVASATQLLGDVEFARGDLDAADTAYSTALHLVPDLPQAELGAMRVGAAHGEATRAIRTLVHLTQRYPLPAAVVLLGDLELASGDRSASQRSYVLVRTIAKLQHASGQVTDLEMAQFASDHGDVVNGLKLAKAAYAARPDNIFAADSLAWARYRNRDFVGAQSLLARSLRLHTADASLRWHAAAILAANNDPRGARRELALALRANAWFTFNPTVRAEVRSLAATLGVEASG